MLRLALVFALCLVIAPAAHASVADRFVPYYDAADGVRVGSGHALHFSAKAKSIYNRFAGRRAEIACTSVKEQPDANGNVDHQISGVLPFRVPRGRRAIQLPRQARDICVLSTRVRINDSFCVHPDDDGTSNQCARLIVAMSDRSRAYMDEYERTLELSLALEAPPTDVWALGADVVELPGPDASPPAGKLGFWNADTGRGAVVLLADGRRWFARFDGDVFSTNVADFVGVGALEITSLF